MNHDSISEIRAILESEGIALKKRFGQNFLVRSDLRTRIADTIRAVLDPGTPGEIWEIGPGLGALTDLLAALDRPLRLFEIDRALIRVLRRRYGEGVTIEEGDAAELLPARLSDLDHLPPAAVVGNLPYRSASAMIAAIVEAPDGTVPVRSMVFLVQEELALRLGAQPGARDYSALSVLVQNSYRVERGFPVPGSAFYPVPRVGSRVISLVARDDAPEPNLRRIASTLARTAFAQRRKTLRNTLGGVLECLEAVGIDPSERPERIDPGRYIELARCVAATGTSVTPPGRG